MKPRHPITKEYEFNPRHRRRWDLTIEWLKQFDTIKSQIVYETCANGITPVEINVNSLDCGDRTILTDMIENKFGINIENTTGNLDKYHFQSKYSRDKKYNYIFVFEIIEHLFNPLFFMEGLNVLVENKGAIYLSTPINRPKWMRNKEKHFHEFNYNELVYLIDTSGFKIVNEKRINCTTWKMITGFRPLLRFFGIDKNILLKLKRK